MTYLLLRDNKQSGPYSLEDLKIKGLKAYDLVWAEGKSAAWRYPSEIGELSAFASAVEEQPFDRFYKKPAAASGPLAATQPAVAVSPEITLTSNPFYSEDQPSTTRKRTIYVTMPGGTAAPVTVRETVREVVRETVRPATALPVGENAFREPARETVRAVGPDNNGDYTGELMPRSKSPRKAAILQPILIGVGILVLLAGGIFIGLSINRDNPGRTITATTASPLPLPVKVAPIVSSAVTTPAPQTQPENPATTTQDRDHSTLTSGAVAGKTGKTAAPKQKVIPPRDQAALSPTTTTDSSAAGIPVIHREAARRTDAADNQEAADKDKGALKVNLASQVSIGANKYEVGTFGGISNLQVTVSNRSAYPLDLVVVEVQYIQANKKTYKTENLYFHGVGPGMAMMQEAPKSSRGIKVEYKVTLINSKELGLSESGL
jgi:hypothetical protein